MGKKDKVGAKVLGEDRLLRYFSFIATPNGKRYEKDLEDKAKEIYERNKKAQENQLKNFDQLFLECFRQYFGKVTNQQHFSEEILLTSVYPYLSSEDRKAPLTEITLEGDKRKYLFAGSLANLVGAEVNLLAFRGERNLLDFLAKEQGHIGGNMGPNPGEYVYEGHDTPILYLPQKEVNVGDVGILVVNNGSYKASIFGRGEDPKDHLRYARQLRVERKRFAGEDELMKKCREEALKEIKIEDYGFKK